MESSSVKLRVLFNFKDDRAKGRWCLLLFNTFTVIYNYINAGVFYSGFLNANDINIVNAGIISFLPYFAGMFSIISPLILSKFKKRRWVLSTGYFLYFFFTLFASTAMPLFVTDTNIRILLFCIFTFVGNLIFYTIVSPGYSEWHLNFIPENVRLHFLSVSQLVSGVVSSVFFLISMIFTDKLTAGDSHSPVFSIIRYITFGIAVICVVIMSLPKEYEYHNDSSLKIKSIFSLPFDNKKFLASIMLIFGWNFFQYFGQTPTDYYITNEIHVPYTFSAIIVLLYSFFLIALTPFWKKMISLNGWIKIYGLTTIVHGICNIIFSTVSSENYIVIMLIVRCTQHVIGVGMNLCASNLMYLNMPEKNRSCFVSFYFLLLNIGMFSGLLCGTLFVDITEGFTCTLFGRTFGNVPLLMVIWGTGMALVGLTAFLLRNKIEPTHKNPET